MSELAIDPTCSALLLVDMQNDFLHPAGAYARGGASTPDLAALPERLATVAHAARPAGISTIATLFTVVQTPSGPLIEPHLARLRPFLGPGDFAPASWGQAPLDEIGSIDVSVEKVAYSAFHASRLEFVLSRMHITTLVVGGIVTNGGVASTVRGAHVLGIDTIVLSDGCAAFSTEAHEAAIASLATITRITTCAEAIDAIGSIT